MGFNATSKEDASIASVLAPSAEKALKTAWKNAQTPQHVVGLHFTQPQMGTFATLLRTAIRLQNRSALNVFEGKLNVQHVTSLGYAK